MRNISIKLKEPKPSKQKIINLILLGKTGSGKSSAGNTILSRRAFKTGDGKTCVTNISNVQSYVKDDLKVRVVDTPGLMDTSNNIEDILQRIFNAMSSCPEGFNALLYVMSYGDRFSLEDKEVLRLLKLCFGENFTNDFCIIIMNKGDNFDLAQEEKMLPDTFNDWLRKEKDKSSEFKDLLEDCSEKVVLFYNNGAAYQTKRENSRKELFEMINSMSGMYTNELFEKFSEHRNQLVKEMKCQHHTQFVQEELSLLNQLASENIDILKEMKTCVDEEVMLSKSGDFNKNIIKLQEKVRNLSTHLKEFGDDAEFLKKIDSSLETLKFKSLGIIRSDINEIETILLKILEKVNRKKDDPYAATIYDKFKVVMKVVGGTALGAAGGTGAGVVTSLKAYGVVSAVLVAPIAVTVAVAALTTGVLVQWLNTKKSK